MHPECAMKQQYASVGEGPLGGYRNADELTQTAIDAAAILRRLVTMRSNYPARNNESMENHAVLMQKIIEIQGLLKL